MIVECGLRVVASTADTLGESPTWHAERGELFWVDLRRPALHRLAPGGPVTTWPMPEVIGAVVARTAGVVVALKTGLHGFDPETAQMTPLVTIEIGPPENRLNDAKCDAAGRLWCGSMWDYGAQTSGGLYRVEVDLRVTKIRADVTIANAIAFSPDRRTIYFTDSRKGAIERADVDLASGTVGAFSEFAAADMAPGRPDGATVDAEGFVWNARYSGGCLARFAPDGRLDRIVALPVSQPTSCAFGGPDLATLYVTTARQKLTAAQLAAEPLAGSLFAFEPGPRGLPEPAFGG